MKAELIGLSGWVFYLSEARRLDALKWSPSVEKKRMRMMETWGQVFPCPMCQQHYQSIVNKYKYTKIPRYAKEGKTMNWFLFVRHEINRKAPEPYLKHVRYHTYRYISAILYSYEPKINPAYCRRVRRFLQEWKPRYFSIVPRATWKSCEALWSILDTIFPREAARFRHALEVEFSHV